MIVVNTAANQYDGFHQAPSLGQFILTRGKENAKALTLKIMRGDATKKGHTIEFLVRTTETAKRIHPKINKLPPTGVIKATQRSPKKT